MRWGPVVNKQVVAGATIYPRTLIGRMSCRVTQEQTAEGLSLPPTGGSV